MNWVKALFSRFKHIFLEKWTDKFAGKEILEGVREEWSVGLAGLSGDQIAIGLDVCRKTMAWPPSIAEFRKACLSDVHRSATYKPFIALPKPPRDKALGSSVLANMAKACR